MRDYDKVIVGIDPGLSGGIVAMDKASTVVRTVRMPVIKGKRSVLDGRAVCDFLDVLINDYEIALVVIEEVSSMPRDGVVQAFGFGTTYGRLWGISEALALPVKLVRPQAWMAVVLHSLVKMAAIPRGSDPKLKTERKKELKARTLGFVKQRWPNADLVGSKSSAAKPSDGIVDAVCIAEYGRISLFGGSQ